MSALVCIRTERVQVNPHRSVENRLAFTVSFDDIVISYFLTGTWMTLPVYIYGMLRFGLSPKVYAISTIILLLSLILITFMARYTGRSAETYRVRKRSAG